MNQSIYKQKTDNNLCSFCIQNKLLRVNVLYEDKLWFITDMEEGSSNNAVMAITKRHIETPFDLSKTEWGQLQSLIDKMKKIVDSKEIPQGYNIGWNVSKTGGQNVPHAHLHLLARYEDEPLAGKGIRYAFKQLNNKRPLTK
jgi:diadenosine tetraphosphate (Ap4A) HIT family hydrolase